MIVPFLAVLSLTQSGQEPRFDGLIAAAADADMTATAYADGRLEPLGPEEGRDSLVLAAEGEAGLLELDRAFASNSVISWPQIIEASADGRTVWVAETRREAPDGLDRMDSVYDGFAAGSALAAYRIAASGAITPLGAIDAGVSPESVSRSPDGAWLVVASRDQTAEAVFVAVDAAGAPVSVREIDLDFTGVDGAEDGLNGLFWNPVEDLIAANVGNRSLVIYRVERDLAGAPSALAPAGPALPVGTHWSVGKWTPDGRFFIATDTGWNNAEGFGMAVQPQGWLTSVRVSATGAAAIGDREIVGLSPEGFDISPDGRLAVTVNMRRTYLPDNPLLALWPGRNQSGLQLVSIDPETGDLARLGPEARFEGVLPEDAIFDQDGDSIAVAVFNLRSGPGRRQGFIDLWRIEATDDGPRLRNTGVRLATVRGPHDLVRLDPD